MANFVFNIAKGKVGYYAGLPGTNDALIAVPLEADVIEADATLKDADTLAAVLAGTSDEQTTMGRKTLAGVTSTIDDTNDWLDVDFTDPVWTAASGAAVAAVVICYVPDNTSPNDATTIPLTKHDFAVTPGGGDVTAVVAAGGFYRAS